MSFFSGHALTLHVIINILQSFQDGAHLKTQLFLAEISLEM